MLFRSFHLELRPEPYNPYDQNAIAVWLDAAHLPQQAKDELQLTLEGTGFDLDDIEAQGEFHVGYVARDEAALHHIPIADFLSQLQTEFPDTTGFDATLSFSATGSYRVTFQL